MKLTDKTTLSHMGLHALVWQEDDLFVAKCAEIEVVSQGKTEEESVKNLEEAVELFFENEPVQISGLTKLRVVSL